MHKRFFIFVAVMLLACVVQAAERTADVVVAVFDSPDPVREGQALTFRLAVTNRGAEGQLLVAILSRVDAADVKALVTRVLAAPTMTKQPMSTVSGSNSPRVVTERDSCSRPTCRATTTTRSAGRTSSRTVLARPSWSGRDADRGL